MCEIHAISINCISGAVATSVLSTINVDEKKMLLASHRAQNLILILENSTYNLRGAECGVERKTHTQQNFHIFAVHTIRMITKKNIQR